MASRKELAVQLREWVGVERLEIVDPGTGWPSHMVCYTVGGPVRLAVHLGPIGESQRFRPFERRFQNPGRNHPVCEPQGEFSVLLGLYEINGKRVLVGMDAYRRLGRMTRQSFFMPLEVLINGSTRGWAEHLSDKGERVIAFSPQLLPLFVEVYRDKRKVTDEEIQARLRQAGVELPAEGAFAAAAGMARITKSAEERIAEAREEKSRHLDLSALGLTAIPITLAECVHLESLDLTRNQLTALPDFLCHFDRLNYLKVAGNDLAALPDFVGRLGRLEHLDVSYNVLDHLPDSVSQLTLLQSLDVSHNQLKVLPESLGQLTRLRRLIVYRNELRVLPPWLTRLSLLEELSISKTNLTALPDWIGGLRSLVHLYAADNQLTSIPDSLCTLEKLESLALGRNPLATLPATFGDLSRLKFLDLNTEASVLVRYGNITIFAGGDKKPTLGTLQVLPESMHTMPALAEILLHGQTALGVPPELLGPGPRSPEFPQSVPVSNAAGILDYYFGKRDSRPLNEAKMILVGRGAVGKTSLVNRLVHNTHHLAEAKTDGIAITPWQIRIGAETVHLNIWDFGGQEIMHATHQFFLTRRSLYLVVLDAREGEQDGNVEYWLRLIESFGGNSPVLVVINKIKDHPHDLNRKGLRDKFPAIRGFYPTDCRADEGLKALSEAIARETNALPHLRDPFPASWLKVKDTLANLPKTEQKSYIPFSRYQEICAANGVTEAPTQETLVGFLHDLGIVVNFRDDPRLAETNILDPEWVTNGIYKILNSQLLAENNGVLHLPELARVLSPRDYPTDMRLYLLDLMRKFELCYAFYESTEHYLVPELLTKEEEVDLKEFEEPDVLRFQYHYNILPEGLLPRLIVRQRSQNKTLPRWRTGLILAWDGNRALVKADIQDKRVSIAVNGPLSGRRRLLSLIRADLDHIHRSIARLEATEHVPVPEYPGLVMEYETLRGLEADGDTVRKESYKGSIVKLVISELLDGVEDITARSRRAQPDPGGRDAVHVAFSYAHEDEEMRDELAAHLKLLEYERLISPWHDRKIKGGEDWANRIDESFNRADLILLLISHNFFASNYCYQTEMRLALERQEKGEARVVPVILRACDWQSAPFGRLQALPEKEAVESWAKRNEAWCEVAIGIREIVEEIRERRG